MPGEVEGEGGRSHRGLAGRFQPDSWQLRTIDRKKELERKNRCFGKEIQWRSLSWRGLRAGTGVLRWQGIETGSEPGGWRHRCGAVFVPGHCLQIHSALPLHCTELRPTGCVSQPSLLLPTTSERHPLEHGMWEKREAEYLSFLSLSQVASSAMAVSLWRLQVLSGDPETWALVVLPPALLSPCDQFPE